MRVRIYQAPKSSMQSGRGHLGVNWLVECLGEQQRRPDQLMGWSSGDSYNQVKLKFQTLESALDFVKSKGWVCEDIEKTHERIVRPRSYMDTIVGGRK
ncbi:MAG: NADH dehydrogenase ubiquinone Fe-S protein 4 [Alphaproteobacteria bacterium]